MISELSTVLKFAAGPIKYPSGAAVLKQDDNDNVEKKGKMTEMDQHHHRSAMPKDKEGIAIKTENQKMQNILTNLTS